MSKNKEYISEAGLRLDGRRPNEARSMVVEFHSSETADGSCTLTAGSSVVRATVFGPQTPYKSLSKGGDATINCDVSIAASVGDPRRNPQQNNRFCEDIGACIVQVARSLVLLSQYPNSVITINIDILCVDGGEKALGINAACLALANASIAMRDVPYAITAGVIENHILMDLTSEEIRSGSPVMSLALSGHHLEQIVWLDTVSRFSFDATTAIVEKAQRCAATMFSEIDSALREDAKGNIDRHLRE